MIIQEDDIITIKDVAVKLGLSISTVSKALNDYSDISSTTRELVMKTAAEMGYFPNANARALKSRRSYNLGVLFSDAATSGLKHPFFSRVLDGFRVRLEEAGYGCTFIGNNFFDKEISYLEHCIYRGIEGVCIACVDFYSPKITELVASDIPTVAIDFYYPRANVVKSANIQGMSELVKYAVEMGHRDIAYIHGQLNFVTKERLAGFQNTLIASNIAINPQYLVAGIYQDADVGYQRTKELLSLEHRPSCIIYSDDFSALGGIKAIREAGLSVPQDISVAGYDGSDFAHLISPVLTTIWQDAETMGREAANMLIDRIERPFTSIIEDKVIFGKLLKGESIRSI